MRGVNGGMQPVFGHVGRVWGLGVRNRVRGSGFGVLRVLRVFGVAASRSCRARV